jgi:DNA replication protein DnaC
MKNSQTVCEICEFGCVMAMVNPFNPKYPIDPKLFANRHAEIEKFKRDIKRTISSKLPENITILGDWGVGKSSLAYKLAHMASNAENAKILSTCLFFRRGSFFTLKMYRMPL